MGWNAQEISLIVLTEQTTGYSGLFGYSPAPGPGNLIFSVSAAAGVDPYGNSYPQGVSSTVGQLSANSLITTLLRVSGGPFLFYGSANAAQATFNAGASGNWTVPSGVTSVTAVLTAGGGNGNNGIEFNDPTFPDGSGGGGGECAIQTFTVTPGSMLAYSVGNAAQNTTFNGITANAGETPLDAFGGAGGTGSNAALAYAGGHGGAGAYQSGNTQYPGGGGGSGGTSQPGNSSMTNLGGAAVTGGGAGGNAFANGGTPGGGGGGGGVNNAGTGGGGLLNLFYSTSSHANTELLLAIANIPGSDTSGNSWGTGLTIAPTGAPATPAAGCIIYYDSGVLYALGPSGNSIAIATT
jgi:hypothetical protein